MSTLDTGARMGASSHAQHAIYAAQTASIDPAARQTLPAELGIQELLAWLATQLDKSDHLIRAQMSALGNAKDETVAMASVKTQLDEALKQSADDKPLDGVATPDAIASSDWYKNLPAGPTKAAVDRFIAKCSYAGDGSPPTAKADDIKQLQEALTDGIGDSSTRNEMGMIQLQSALSSRGQLVQMISNMVSSVEETTKGIVGNTRV